MEEWRIQDEAQLAARNKEILHQAKGAAGAHSRNTLRPRHNRDSGHTRGLGNAKGSWLLCTVHTVERQEGAGSGLPDLQIVRIFPSLHQKEWRSLEWITHPGRAEYDVVSQSGQAREAWPKGAFPLLISR